MMKERAKMNLTISRKNKSQANVKDKIVAWEVKKKKNKNQSVSFEIWSDTWRKATWSLRIDLKRKVLFLHFFCYESNMVGVKPLGCAIWF